MNKQGTILTGMAVLLMAILAIPVNALAKERVVFSGGPAGGTFQVVANAMQVYKPIKASADFRVRAQSSAGSVENLRKVNSGKAQMGVVYSGHVYLGRNGRMKNDPNKYEDVMAVAWLYGAPAQLVVRKDSGIKSTADLVGKKVGVGNAGSGAFANCELFFTHMGMRNGSCTFYILSLISTSFGCLLFCALIGCSLLLFVRLGIGKRAGALSG